MDWLSRLLAKLGLGSYYLYVTSSWYRASDYPLLLIFGPYLTPEAALGRYPKRDGLFSLHLIVKFHLFFSIPNNHSFVSDVYQNWIISETSNQLRMKLTTEIQLIEEAEFVVMKEANTYTFALNFYADLGNGRKHYCFLAPYEGSILIFDLDKPGDALHHTEKMQIYKLAEDLSSSLPERIYELKLLNLDIGTYWFRVLCSYVARSLDPYRLVHD